MHRYPVLFLLCQYKSFCLSLGRCIWEQWWTTAPCRTPLSPVRTLGWPSAEGTCWRWWTSRTDCGGRLGGYPARCLVPGSSPRPAPSRGIDPLKEQRKQTLQQNLLYMGLLRSTKILLIPCNSQLWNEYLSNQAHFVFKRMVSPVVLSP